VTNTETSAFANLLEALPDALVGAGKPGLRRFSNRHTRLKFGYERDGAFGALRQAPEPEPVRQASTAHRRLYNADLRTRIMGADLSLTRRRRDSTKFRPASRHNPCLYDATLGQRRGGFAATGDMTNELAHTEMAEQHARERDRPAKLERSQRLTLGRELKMIELNGQTRYLGKFAQAEGGGPDEQH
jgi:hypothetical protein